ncbi:MAG: amidohydrolase family protein [Planctomycetota bacterium]|nr:amidohydrolase family protein [Planctomycetota bacterium]
MPPPTRIIDSHQHVFWHGRDDAGLVADLDEHGIDKALLLTWCIHPTEGDPGYDEAFNPIHTELNRNNHPGLTLSDAVCAARRYPDRFIIGYAPHPLESNAAKWLDAAIRMYDIRAFGEWKCRMLLDDPRCIELFRLAGQRDLPVVLHIDVPYRPDEEEGEMKYRPEWYGGTVANLERAMQACPNTIFVGHGPGLWREISGDADTAIGLYPEGPIIEGGRLLRLMEDYPKLFLDLSAGSAKAALRRDLDFSKIFVLKYHERMLFGRDCYSDDLHEFLQSLSLPDEAVENIYHRNAERLFRIES